MITKRRIGLVFSNDEIIVDSYDWKGLSTDEKPTNGVAVNDEFKELDTGDKYYFDGEVWQKAGVVV